MDAETKRIEESVATLQRCYMEYMKALKTVLDFGERNIPTLVAALNHKHANPIAKALGLMRYAAASEEAIPRLLDWLTVQSPLYPDVLEALVRMGPKVIPLLRDRVREAASRGDDEAVRSLLDLGTRLRDDNALGLIVTDILALLSHPNEHLRETAADAIWRIGLPAGRPAEAMLRRIAADDPAESTRRAAHEALVRLGVAQWKS